MYTIGRALAHAKLITLNAKSSYFQEMGKMCVQDALIEFFSRDWPFLHGEAVITTTPSYNTGTITLTEGSTTGAGVGTTWDTNWPTPAIIRADNSHGEEFLVTSFNSTTGLTLDAEWPYDTDTVNYTLEFPCYEIPDYLYIEDVMTAYAFKRVVDANSYGEIMLYRHGWIQSGYPGWYCIIPGDTTRATKMWISPAPNDTYTLRYTYKAAVPEFLIHNFGTATFTNANATVTGSTGTGTAATNWNATGFTMAGKIIEAMDEGDPQPYANGTILSVGGASSITLTSNWTGRSQTAVAYSVSPRINIPDDLIPTFRALVECYVYARIKPEAAGLARQMYQSHLMDSCQRYERDMAPMKPRGVNGWMQADEAETGPGMPTELTVRTI